MKVRPVLTSPGANRPTPQIHEGAQFPIELLNTVTIWLSLEDVGQNQGCVRSVACLRREGLRPRTSSGTLGFIDYGASCAVDGGARAEYQQNLAAELRQTGQMLELPR